MVYALTEKLVKRGHDVTLFASGDSISSAKLVSVYPRSLREARIKDLYGLNDLMLFNIGLAYSRQKEFDIIHDHNAQISLPTANLCTVPVVFTLHGPISLTQRKMLEELGNPHLVAVSHAQKDQAPRLNFAGVVYNGLDMEQYPFSAEHDGYLLSVGRISAEKGTHLAIQAAQYLNLPLVIAAKLDAMDMPYFQQYIAPLLSEDIRWVGEVDEQERNRLMSKARCLLHPVTWREPFGLVMIEAMACGCPVIGFRRGSIPEIVKDGKTGFVVGDLEEMLEAILKIDTIDRQECRKYAIEHFHTDRMADGYEKIYRTILERN